MHDSTRPVDLTPVRLGDRWFDDGMDLELWTEDGRAGLRIHVTRSGELIASRLPSARGGRAWITLDPTSSEISVEDPAGVLGQSPADLGWLRARLDPELREAIAQRARRVERAREDDRHGWKEGGRPRISLGERARFCDVFPMSWDVLVTHRGKRYALIDRYRIDAVANLRPLALEVIDLGTGAPVGTAELESIHSRGRQKRPWRASDGRVDQLLRELRRRAGAWIRLLGRPEDIVRVACRLATWDADRATPDAVVREALADDGDLDGDRSDRAIALGEHAVPALRRALEAGEPAARCRAARLLAAIGDASGVHVLAAAIIGDGGDGGDADHAADIYGGVDSERYAIVEELEGLGARALEPLLEVLHHAGADPDQRWLALEALVGIEVRDDRIRDALIRELEIDSGAASLLAQYGDGGPVVAEAIRLALARRIDQLADDLDVALKHDELRALLEAARALGALSPELTDLLEVALDKARVEDAWEDGARDEGDGDPGFEDEAAFRVRAAVRPGRNEPCWCGSGQKYKRCHLDSDAECDRIGRL